MFDRGVKVSKIFVFEYGFCGDYDVGVYVKSIVDVKIGIDVVFIYGSNKKLIFEVFVDFDVIIFDI